MKVIFHTVLAIVHYQRKHIHRNKNACIQHIINPFYTGLFEASYTENTLFSDPANDSIVTASSQQSPLPLFSDPANDSIATASSQLSSPPLITSHLIQQRDEVRPEELSSTPDVIECERFYLRTCGCDKNQGNPCSKQFPLEHYIEQRAQCSFLTNDELDLVLIGFREFM